MFLYALILLRSTQVKAALQYFAEGNARPLSKENRAKVIALADSLPTSPTDKFFVDVLDASKPSGKEKWGRFAARTAMILAFDWGATVATLGVY